MKKQRNKLKPSDIEKIQARYAAKYKEFSELPLYDVLEEDGVTVKQRGLRTIWREKRVLPTDKEKMSSTDTAALVHVVDARMRKQMAEIADKEAAEELKVEENDNGGEQPVTSESASE
jgi:hypothetical protein